jgi:hypothetical protein
MKKKLKLLDEESKHQHQEEQEPKNTGCPTISLPKSDENIIVHKKRGRKPKGGKIICASEIIVSKSIVSEPNIILHLKCKKDDLNELVDENNITSVKYEPNIQNVENYQFDNSKTGELHYCMISSLENTSATDSNSETTEKNNTNTDDKNKNKDDKKQMTFTINHNHNSNSNNTIPSTNCSNINDKPLSNNESYTTDDSSTTKLLRRKIKELSIQMLNNDIADKKSACFWCTFDFDNPPIYIPKHELNNTYYCYGCFCSPECATASLFKESIDTSVKFERYHLINHIYCKIYDYNKNVKPAPDPYYMLDKYYGNLTIQEYRRLLKNNRLILIVDKPFTRSLPELYDENDDYIINNKTIPSSSNNSSSKYKLRQGKNKNSKAKNTILNENFNF